MVIVENYCRNPKNNEWQSLVKCESCNNERVTNKYAITCGRHGEKFCYGCSRKRYFQNKISAKIIFIQNSKGLKLISDMPKRTSEKVVWECSNGHRFSTSIKNCIDNIGCLGCYGKTNKTLNDYLEIAQIKECEFVGPMPEKAKFSTWWKCKCGSPKFCSYEHLRSIKYRLKCLSCIEKERVETQSHHRLWHKEITEKIKHITTEESWNKLKISASLNDLKTIKGIIYLYQNKINKKVLVGQSLKTFFGRYRGIPDGWVRYASGEMFKNALLKYGIENFNITILEKDVKTRKELNDLEEKYIKLYKSDDREFGYNMTKGGEVNGYSSMALKSRYEQSIERGKKFAEKAMKLYPHYDYNKIIYQGRKYTVANIFCNKCGTFFSQSAEQHLKGFNCPCPTCRSLNGNIRKASIQDFLTKAFEKHGEKYEYDASSYIHSHEKINIFCNDCCKWFQQTVRAHLKHNNCCPNCRGW